MRKLSEINGEDALDVLADIVDPLTEILTDKDVAEEFRSGQRIKAISVALKNHKKAALTIMAILDGEDVEKYKPNLLALPRRIIDILNDPMIQELFSSESQTEAASSGSPTESTEATEEK